MEYDSKYVSLSIMYFAYTPCLICARKYPLLPFIGLKFVAWSAYLLYVVLIQLLLIVLLEFALLIQILRQYNQSRTHLERKLIEKEKRFHHIDPSVMKYYALLYHILE